MQSIKVANDLTGCTGHGLIVGADNLEIDLGGRRFSGDGGGSDYGIYIDNHTSVTVTHGKLNNFGAGVFLAGAGTTSNTFSKLTLFLNAFGMVLNGADVNTIERNLFLANSEAGLGLDAGSDENKVRSNKFEANKTGIAMALAKENNLSGNEVEDSTVFGVSMTDSDLNRLELNDIAGSKNDGVRVLNDSDFNQFYKNKILSGEEAGIYVEGSDCDTNLIHNNKVNKNHVGGIVDAGAETDIRENTANGNGFEGKDDPGDGAGGGIDATTDASVTSADNKAKGNDGANCSANVECNV